MVYPKECEAQDNPEFAQAFKLVRSFVVRAARETMGEHHPLSTLCEALLFLGTQDLIEQVLRQILVVMKTLVGKGSEEAHIYGSTSRSTLQSLRQIYGGRKGSDRRVAHSEAHLRTGGPPSQRGHARTRRSLLFRRRLAERGDDIPPSDSTLILGFRASAPGSKLHPRYGLPIRSIPEATPMGSV